MKRLFPLAFVALLLSLSVLRAAPAIAIDWPRFLARQDLIWSSNPKQWEDGAYIGNGLIGANIFVQHGALAWEINRADVYHLRERFPMGRVALKTAGAITGGEVRLDLWNAEARGVLKTDRGEVRWRSFTATQPSVIVLEFEGGAGERDVDVEWIPAEARPPRKVYRKEEFSPHDLHPPAEVRSTAQALTSTQRFLNGGAFAVDLRRHPGGGAKKTVYIGIGRGADEAAAVADASTGGERATSDGLAKVERDHRAWWQAYYPASFASFPDARLEAFYWIQVYKLGAAMRPDGPILDLMGPWFRRTPWPRIWWNLNVQLTYHPLTTANRLAQSESLFRALDRGRQALMNNAPEEIRADAAVIGRSSDQSLSSPVNLATANGDAGKETGNLPWVMFIYWEYYRAQMDESILRDRVLPLLALATGHYLAYLEKDGDGRYHLPPTHSPEFATVADTNYDLAFLRWGLQTLVTSHERLKLDDPRLSSWRDVLANLTPPPIDETGLMIGQGRRLDASHRHYSHLVGIYPLHLITPETRENEALIRTSLKHWLSMPEKHEGYSHTGAASIHAMLREGEQAVDQLNRLMDTKIHPNTLYTEAGPVIETPLSAMSSLQELMLQSWGGVVRVFPAVPGTWADTSFANLRSEGAFLVSAVRRNGRTAWVRIESLAGEPCRLVVDGWTAAVSRETSSGEPCRLKVRENGEIDVKLAKGEWVVLTATPNAPLPELTPVELPEAQHNPYPQRYR